MRVSNRKAKILVGVRGVKLRRVLCHLSLVICPWLVVSWSMSWLPHVDGRWISNFECPFCGIACGPRSEALEILVFWVGYRDDEGVESGGVGGFEGAGYGLERCAGGHDVVDDQDAFVMD